MKTCYLLIHNDNACHTQGRAGPEQEFQTIQVSHMNGNVPSSWVGQDRECGHPKCCTQGLSPSRSHSLTTLSLSRAHSVFHCPQLSAILQHHFTALHNAHLHFANFKIQDYTKQIPL